MVMKKKAAAPVKKAAAKRGPAPKAAATKRRPVEDDDDDEEEEDEEETEDATEDVEVSVEASGDFTVTVHRSVTHRYEDGTLDNWTSTATGAITTKMDAEQAQAQINAMRVATGMAIGADYAAGKDGTVVIGEPTPLRKTAAGAARSTAGGAAAKGKSSGGSGGGESEGYSPKEKKALWAKLIEDIDEEEEVPPSNWWDNRTDKNGKRSKWPNFKPKKEVMEELGIDRTGEDIKPLYLKDAPDEVTEKLAEYDDPF